MQSVHVWSANSKKWKKCNMWLVTQLIQIRVHNNPGLMLYVVAVVCLHFSIRLQLVWTCQPTQVLELLPENQPMTHPWLVTTLRTHIRRHGDITRGWCHGDSRDWGGAAVPDHQCSLPRDSGQEEEESAQWGPGQRVAEEYQWEGKLSWHENQRQHHGSLFSCETHCWRHLNIKIRI